jgi:hypothetical protein
VHVLEVLNVTAILEDEQRMGIEALRLRSNAESVRSKLGERGQRVRRLGSVERPDETVLLDDGERGDSCILRDPRWVAVRDACACSVRSPFPTMERAHDSIAIDIATGERRSHVGTESLLRVGHARMVTPYDEALTKRIDRDAPAWFEGSRSCDEEP